MTSMVRIGCRYCTKDHIYVCNCGHQHDGHTYGGGCNQTLADGTSCPCEGYDQSQQRLPMERQESFDKRILAKAKKAGKR